MKDKLMRADSKFVEELEEIARERIKNGRDKKFTSERRITEAIRRHTEWSRIKEDISKALLD